MIETIKKRFQVNDPITIYQNESSITGRLLEINDSCIVLLTEDGNEEYIQPATISRISKPKAILLEISNSTKNISVKNEENTTKNDVLSIGSSMEKLQEPVVEETVQSSKIILSKPEKTDKQKPHKFTSLSQLSELILPKLEADNDLILPARGYVHTYWSDRDYGFITDKKGFDLNFSYNDIMDEELFFLIKGKTSKHSKIPVIYSEKYNYGGKKAVCIQKPKKISDLLELAKGKQISKEYPMAIFIVEQILSEYPNNFSAQKLKNEFNNQYTKKPHGTKQYKPMDNAYFPNYQKAKREHNIHKNYTEALKFYMIALEKNEKRESCIKDISMLYIAMGEHEKALEFLESHVSKLPLNITNYYYLENFYSSVKNFEKVIFYIDLLLREVGTYDKRRYSMLLSKKGLSLIKLDRMDDAKKILEQATDFDSENTGAKKLLDAINNPNSEEFDKVIAESDFSSFGGGLSKFIKDTIDSYDDYYGVPLKIIESKDFTKETLNYIRTLIDPAGKARPRERANYLLTEAKLMWILEPQKDNYLRSVLARYCNAMALFKIYESEPLDIVRNYFLEAFNLEKNWTSVIRQFELFIVSLKNNHQEIIVKIRGGQDITENDIFNSISEYFNSDRREYWDNLLNVFICNTTILVNSLPLIYKAELIRNKSIKYLKNLEINTDINSLESFSSAWNEARDKRQREIDKWFASVKAVYQNDNLESLLNQISINRENWLGQIDNHRLLKITTDIKDTLNQFLKYSSPDDKERSYNFARTQINQLISEIREQPTKLSYEALIPLLEKMNVLLEKSFQKLLESSTPKVKISILVENTVVYKERIVPIHIQIVNEKDSLRIRDIKIVIIDDANVKFIEKDNTYPDSIEGGKDHIFKLSVKVSDNVIQDKATTLNILCEYKIRDQEIPIKIEEHLSLRLYSENEFQSIRNLYVWADGSEVTDKKMFFGRDKFIDIISDSIVNSDSKQVIIYGQKRSGKSSVLYHLKKNLLETNQTFCIYFSLGDIIKDLNDCTFYYKILTAIQDELELLEVEGKQIPEFTIPSYTDFSTLPNPSDTFRKYIALFKRSCLQLEEWKNKKLVVMIDEFTYLYTSIKKGKTSDTIMKQWKAVTQNEAAKFSVVLIAQDTVQSFKNEDYAKNAFGVIQDIRLTYLDEADARRLIEEPTNTNFQGTRFIGNSVDAILEYTSYNPYYIQIFCNRLIEYMNQKKLIKVTEADVKDVAELLLEGSQALPPEKYDNLIRAGEKYDIPEFEDEPIIKVLRQIAVGSKNIGLCPRESISIGDKNLEDKILNHLYDREVIEKKTTENSENYKILVRLFKEWLLRN